MELVVTEIQRCVDWLVGLKVDIDFLLLSRFRDDGTAVDHESVRRATVVQLELVLVRSRALDMSPTKGYLLLCGGNGTQNREAVHAILDVGSSTILVCQHLRVSGHLQVHEKARKTKLTTNIFED